MDVVVVVLVPAVLLLLLFHGHYAGQPALVGTPGKELEDFLEQSFTVCMPLLKTTSDSIMEKTPEFSSLVLPVWSLYCYPTLMLLRKKSHELLILDGFVAVADNSSSREELREADSVKIPPRFVYVFLPLWAIVSN